MSKSPLSSPSSGRREDDPRPPCSGRRCLKRGWSWNAQIMPGCRQEDNGRTNKLVWGIEKKNREPISESLYKEIHAGSAEMTYKVQ
ncbi:hypothetical protein AVEN_136157-1 [Araneus ventricosus]|uniref:Uncharacterized protein n=1 Tax=Araneus ventricosus TaxID=182803 RepID=A0A4Y1ZPG5_ARAVE|nr:hypothetical protein AVEN_136157-1 [Araneus ventricosus]